MLSLFRKIRQKLLSQNRITRYLAYAVGEIVLVTIGILIALQINTWNEERKEKIALKKIYLQIQQDLQKDKVNLKNAIEDLEEKNERLTAIINRTIPSLYYDTLNSENYTNCEYCKHDITTLLPFPNLDKGYQLLKAMNPEQDSLNQSIVEFYEFSFPQLEIAEKLLADMSEKYLEEYKDYDWFVDFATPGRTYNKGYVDYLFKSEKHRKDCAHYMIYSDFAIRVWKWYGENAEGILELIDKKLKE